MLARTRASFFCLTIFLGLTGGVILFDFVCYFFLPESAVAFAPLYRNPPILIPEFARSYPRGYFTADSVMGFDITPNISGMHYAFENTAVEIFSNELGCFDRNSLASIRAADTFDYFAGDSFAWGYAEYDSKFATVYEARSGHLTVKCGVTHTGQRQQFEKFNRTIQTIGRYPNRVFVFYYDNDPANDYAYPHSTTIDGFQVDTVDVRNGVLIHRELSELKKRLEKSLGDRESGGVVESVRQILRRYSMTANLARFAENQALRLSAPERPSSFYSLMHQYDFKKNYLSNEITKENRDAIARWKENSREHGYGLIFVLIPPKYAFNDESYYEQLKTYLSQSGIDYLDLTKPFRESNKKKPDLYWKVDAHLNNSGNAFLGELLAKQYQ